MTKNELRSIINEMVQDELDIQNYKSIYESYLVLENSIYQDIINTYSESEIVYENYIEFLNEEFIVNRKAYDTKEQAEKAISMEIESLREKINNYKKRLEDVKANPKKYDDNAEQVLINKIKNEEELISKRATYLRNALKNQIDRNALKGNDVANAAANLKNPETKTAIANAADNATSDNASEEEVKEKVAEEVAKKFPGLKAIKGNIKSTFTGEKGKAKQYLAIAGLATAIVGSITAMVMIRKKKKAKKESEEK